MFKVVKRRQLNDNMFWLVIEAPLVARKAKPGQFVILITDEFGERIPLTMAGHDSEAGTIDLIFAAVGRTTMLMSQLQEGDALMDVVGPLGKPTNMDGLNNNINKESNKKQYYLSCLVKTSHHIKGVCFIDDNNLNFKVFLNQKTGNAMSGVEKGFTTDKLKELIESGKEYDEIVAVGPPMMMKFTCKMASDYGIHSIASLTAYMIDGTGMCGGCRCKIGGEDKFVCVDGPEFDGALVDWDDLIKRSNYYKEQEAEDRAHVCRLTGGVRYND